jgi:hypothetical protein
MSYTSISRVQTLVNTNVYTSTVDDSTKTIDGSASKIGNIRGIVTYTVTASDTSYAFSFQVLGGFGEYPDKYTQDWDFIPYTDINCTIEIPIKNTIIVTTNDIGRVYTFIFQPYQSVATTIERTSGTITPAGQTTSVRSTTPRVQSGGF